MYLPPLFINSFQYTSLYPLPSQMLCIIVLLMCYPSLFFSLFPEFHRVVLLLQTCSTLWSCLFAYKFIFMFCVYVYLWIYLSYMRENMQSLSFWVWLTSLSMMSSNCIHYLQTMCHCSLWLSKTPLHIYIYTTFFDPCISCRAPGLFPKLDHCK
jgi:hypothetical protein